MDTPQHNVIHYDAARRRLWIAGQRCHHGATGALLAGVAATGLIASRLHLNGVTSVALLVTGTALMADDWHDRYIWFERGWQNQP
ncbi:MAG: hypothetical protein JWP18_858 [Solirubrobacterales bacterium]|jgi:hypothetical protein|nr:hypothetical protein [Solirubrobacterales bacterium]